jgi:hypothetical protein
MPKPTRLLVCKCGSCLHWEIAKGKIICKTCGLTVKAKIEVEKHDNLHWETHQR